MTQAALQRVKERSQIWVGQNSHFCFSEISKTPHIRFPGSYRAIPHHPAATQGSGACLPCRRTKSIVSQHGFKDGPAHRGLQWDPFGSHRNQPKFPPNFHFFLQSLSSSAQLVAQKAILMRGIGSQRDFDPQIVPSHFYFGNSFVFKSSFIFFQQNKIKQ